MILIYKEGCFKIETAFFIYKRYRVLISFLVLASTLFLKV
jgi:hypothetical protein